MRKKMNKTTSKITKHAYLLRLLSLFKYRKKMVAFVVTGAIFLGVLFSPMEVHAREGRDKSEIQIEDLSEQEFMSYIEKVENGMENHEDAEVLFETLEESYEYILKKLQNIELMDINTSLDITLVYDNYAQEKSDYRNWYDTFVLTVKELCENDEYADACKEYIGEEGYEEYCSYEGMTEEEDAYLTKIDTLISKVDEIKATETVEINGKEYTMASLRDASLSGELTERQYYLGYYELCENCYDEVSSTFLEIVQLRNEFAVYKGYDNYMECLYEVDYKRDYTYEQAKMLREYLVEKWVPSYTEYSEKIAEWEKEIKVEEFTTDRGVELVKRYLPMINYTYRESIDYAEGHHLWDLEDRGGKVSYSFVQDLSFDKVPFLSIHGVKDFYDLSVFAHELGHYNAAFHSSEEYWITPCNILDIAEIHSQGSELLFSLYYESMTPNAAFAQAYSIETVEELILYAAMMDGIEYDIFTNPELTAEDIDASFVYWMNEFFDYGISKNNVFAKTWIFDDVWYSSPCYYVSYVVSGFTALNIYTVAAVNYQLGVDLYMDVVNSDWKYSYLELVKEYNFLNPFDEENCNFLEEKIVEQYENCLAGEPACSPYIKWKK